ncbi:mucin-binding protein [Weissella confusa]|uniref:mucin-binding protein n=1 Tax=Weissella confusa TaxID=1583 RepID=UPI0022DF37F5|nr:MucBP domain-containing protein [Weissella confusa]
MSDAQVEPAKTAVSTQPDPSAATGAVVTPTSATLTTDATTTESTDQEAAAKSVSTPAPATTTTTPVAATTSDESTPTVSEKQPVAETSVTQQQTATQASAQPVVAVADASQNNAQQAAPATDVKNVDENESRIWDYATDDAVRATVGAKINGALDESGKVIADGGDFTQSGSNTARVVNGYSVTVSIDNTKGKYRNGDTIEIPIYGEMKSTKNGVASQKFDVVSSQGTLFNGTQAFGKYAISNGALRITLTTDLLGNSISDLKVAGSSDSPIANTAIWFNLTGTATINFGDSYVSGTLTFKAGDKPVDVVASTSQALHTKSDSVVVQSFFQDNQYLDALYKGNVSTAMKEESGKYNTDLVQMQDVTIEGTVKAITSDRTYANFFVPKVNNGIFNSSSVTAAAITLVTKDLQIEFEANGMSLPTLESEVAKALKSAGIGAYAIVKINPNEYLLAYNIGNPYSDYSTEKLSGNSQENFTKVLKDGGNQGNLIDADLNNLQNNITAASNNKLSVGAGSISHLFNVLFADNSKVNSVSTKLDTYDTDGHKITPTYAVPDKSAKTTPDKQDFNGQARLQVEYVDERGNDLSDTIISFGNPGDDYPVNVMDIPGYYVDSFTGGQLKGKYGDANDTTTIVITYKAIQKATVTFVDQDNNEELDSVKLTGKQNAKDDYTPGKEIAYYESKGYEVVSNDFPATGLVYDTDKTVDQAYTVVLKHKTTTVDPKTPEIPGQPIDPKNPEGPKWPKGVTKDDLTKKVNETVNYVYDDGTKAADSVKDAVSFSRIATVDDVTGKVTYGDWVADGDTTFDAKQSSVLAGYTASNEQIDAIEVTADTGDVTKTVTYTLDNQKATVTFIDETAGNKTLETVPLTGKSNAKDSYTPEEKIAYYVSKGDEVVSNDFPATGLVYDTDKTVDQAYTVVLKHKTTTVDPKTPEVPETPIDPKNPDGPKWPKGVESKDLNKTVNETVNYVYADNTKAADSVKDEVSFSRIATVDDVTGAVTYGDWTAKDNDTTFDAKESPKIAGYTPKHANVPAVTGLTANTGNVEATVIYEADDQKVVYNVIDDTNSKNLVTNELFDEGVTAGELTKTKADLQTIANDFVKQGYNVVSVDDVPATFDNDDDTDQVVNIHLTHTMKPVTDENQLDLKVTEIVHYVYKDGKTAAPDVTDTVEFTRTRTIDEATGNITYTDWTAVNGDNSFDTKVSPVITGYIANEANVAEVDGLTSASKNVEETVTYSKLGSYVPELPDGSTPSVPYPNDPTNPRKPGTDVPVMPHVPGYTPVGPDGKPLTPVDPQDPSKGYNPPAVPSDPTTDTVIKYGADKQNVVYNVINDTTGENLATNVLFDSGDTDAALT